MRTGIPDPRGDRRRTRLLASRLRATRHSGVRPAPGPLAPLPTPQPRTEPPTDQTREAVSDKTAADGKRGYEKHPPRLATTFVVENASKPIEVEHREIDRGARE